MMDKEVFSIFNTVYSENAELPLFTLKVLSKLFGYSPLPFNAYKVMLLEKTAAIRIFGYAPSFNTLRSGYFLCYTGYTLADKKTDVKDLTGYSRKIFLRYRGDMPEQYITKRLKK